MTHTDLLFQQEINARYKELALEVIKVACDDYVKAGVKEAKLQPDEELSSSMKKNRADSIAFFNSDLPQVFADVDGAFLKEACNRRIAEELRHVHS